MILQWEVWDEIVAVREGLYNEVLRMKQKLSWVLQLFIYCICIYFLFFCNGSCLCKHNFLQKHNAEFDEQNFPRFSIPVLSESIFEQLFNHPPPSTLNPSSRHFVYLFLIFFVFFLEAWNPDCFSCLNKHQLFSGWFIYFTAKMQSNRKIGCTEYSQRFTRTLLFCLLRPTKHNRQNYRNRQSFFTVIGRTSASEQ